MLIDRRTRYSDPPEYLSVEELQVHLGIGRTAAYDFARQHGVKFGRLLRVPKSALPVTSRQRSDSSRFEVVNNPLDTLTREQVTEMVETIIVPALLKGVLRLCAPNTEGRTSGSSAPAKDKMGIQNRSPGRR